MLRRLTLEDMSIASPRGGFFIQSRAHRDLRRPNPLRTP
jgi:hypothetical protein